MAVEIRRLGGGDLELFASIDRTERVTTGYRMTDGTLEEYPVEWNVPDWFREGDGDHSVGRMTAWVASALERGGVLLGAFDAGTLLGLATVVPGFEPGMAWLPTLHVGKQHRRRGAATALWDEAVTIARAEEAASMYVSATPSESAVGFYMSRGCVVADEPHPELHALEPEDIHLIVALG